MTDSTRQPFPARSGAGDRKGDKLMNLSIFRLYLTVLVAVALYSAPGVLRADDTEIFEAQATTNTTSRPKVLIVFDDSGSMAADVVTRPAYDPSRTDYQGGVFGDMFDRIYWSTDGEAPAANSDQWFYASQNRCASSFDPLENQGFSGTGGARRWVNASTTESCQNTCTVNNGFICGVIGFGGSSCSFSTGENICAFLGGTFTTQCETTEIPGRWSPLSTNANNPLHVECKADVTDPANPGNGPGVADGFALDNVDDADALGAATPEASDASGVDWGGGVNDPPPTFYSANYVDYWNDPNLIETRTRMEIAKDVVGDLIDANTSVDFALASFNRNQDTFPPQHGGRILRRLIEGMDTSERNSLISIVRDDIQEEPFSLTPLCETMYEVYRYYTGDSVLYGNQKAPEDVPDRDTQAESSGSYDSPLGDCAFIYTILMTDGQPTNDTAANADIEALTGETCAEWPQGGTRPDAKNCLPNLAGYMSTTDLDGDATNGEQFALTYTIGFGLGDGQEDMLIETANRGGGQHFTAQDADTLATAFQGALLNIQTQDSSFTSPAVSVDSFTRTESRDDVFFAMFKPDQRVDWRGNIKRFKVEKIDGESVVVDKGGVPAFDATTGEFKDSVSSFWSDGDGGAVEAGGVGELLANRDPATRVIYSNTGSGGALELFNSSNVTPDAFGDSTDVALWGRFGVGSQTDFEKVLAWAQGFDTDETGAPTDSPRAWIMGDVLHSRPFPVNYGALGSFTEDNPDQRILVGTNSGFVHFFGNNDGEEDWAFFPKELGTVLNKRRINLVSNDNVYGVDLTPAIYRVDANRDGTISAADGDKLWAYFGLRRGGRKLYALDISNPDSPGFLWMVSEFSDGFAELGQTWSRPVAAHIPGYVDGSGVPKPVVIFGAGYDPNKDSSAVGTPDDSMGRGIFVVDAETGALVRSITPADASLTNVEDDRLEHSVPGEIATLDSNGDELVDRLYFGDTGGNVWRVDIGPRIPDGGDPTETWFLSHFADLNQSTVATDRRFFNKPDIVRTTIDGKPIDAVLMGSGDRTNPLATDVENFFYMLRDPRIAPYSTPDPAPSDCDPGDEDNLPLDPRCGQPIPDSALFDISSDILNTGSDDEKADARAALAAAAGWKLQLERLGEKNLSNSITLGGEVIFSTFTPSTLLNNNPNVCEPSNGVSRRFFVDIFTGEREETLLPPGEIPGGSTLFVDSDGNISVFNPPGTPPSGDPNDPDDVDCKDGLCDLLQQFPVPYGNYWYSEDY